MSTPRVPLLATVLLLCIGLLAGCSSGDDETPEAAATNDAASGSVDNGADRAEVIDEGNSICAEVYAAVAGLDQSSSSVSVKASQRADLYEGMVERLRGLNSRDQELTDLFAAGRDLVTAAESASDAAAEGDAVATTEFEQDLETALAEFERTAADLEFEDCAGEGSTVVESVESSEAPDSEGTAPVEPDATVDDGTTESDPVEAQTPDTGGSSDDGSSNTDGAVAPTEPEGGGEVPDSGGGGGGPSGSGGSGATGGFSPG